MVKSVADSPKDSSTRHYEDNMKSSTRTIISRIGGIILVGISAFLTSCATVPSYPPDIGKPGGAEAGALPPGMGTLVLGRPSMIAGGASRINIGLDGVEIASLPARSYSSLLVEAGSYKARIEMEIGGRTIFSSSRNIQIDEGRTLFLECDFAPANLLDKAITCQPVPRLDYRALHRTYAFYAGYYRDGGTIALGDTVTAPGSRPPGAEPKVRTGDLGAAATQTGAGTANAGVDVAAPDNAAGATGAQANAAGAADDAIPLDFELRSGTSAFAANAIAIVIGNRNYRRGVDPVLFAQNDAAAFRKTLETDFGMAPKDIWYFPDASLADLIGLFGGDGDVRKSRLFRSASLRDSPPDLIVYYSGHGAPATSGQTRGEGYLVPIDADPAAIQNTGYGIDTLLGNIAAMKDSGVIARAWVAIDACFSGQEGDGSYLVKNVSGLTVVPTPPGAPPKGTVLMLAASGLEYASWYPERGHGLFTYFLIKGLNGGADFNGDGKVSVDEIARYLRLWVPRYANGLNAQDQMPQVLGGDGTQNLVEFAK